MEDFFDRLDKFMSDKGLNDNKMTVQTGLAVGALGKQRKGSRGLSVDSIAKILLTYSDLDADWLITGRTKDTQPAVSSCDLRDQSQEALINYLKEKDKRIEELLVEKMEYKIKYEEMKKRNAGID